MTLNKREERQALIASKYNVLEKELTRKYRGCSVTTDGSHKGMRLSFMKERLYVVHPSNVLEHVQDASISALIGVACLVDELQLKLEVAVESLPKGYHEALTAITNSIEKLRGVEIEEINSR